MSTHPPRITAPFVLAALFCFTSPALGQTLTAEDAVGLALERNPNLRAAALELEAAHSAVRSAESEYRPSFRAGLDGGRSESFSGTLEGVAPNADDRISLDLGVSHRTSWGTEIGLWLGGSWRAREVNRDPSTTSNMDLGSTYGLEATLEVRQPLLRGAGRDVGQADLRSARLSRTAAEHARAREASELVRDVLDAYWELWYAQAALEVQRAALEVARQQLAEARTRANELGTLAPAELLRFDSEIAAIEEDLAQAETNRRTQAIALGRLLDLPPAEAADLVVAPAAPPAAPAPSLDEAVDLARARSSELLELETQVAQSRDRVEVAEDATLPRLDLTGSLTVGGLWNDDTITTLDLPGDRPAVGGLVGLELELPLGNGRARAALAEARTRAEASEVRYEARSRQIEAEAATLVSRLEAADRRVELSRRSVEVARRLAEAERQRLELGTATPLEVVEAQESQRTTELRHLRALVDRTSAANALHHLTGELLAQHPGLDGAHE